ncbi:hypothetical protein ABB37_04199 [Leptomonas pyrrhocoris]|uniref:Uncharacterized protein n=1 Tax=Leptomonas pyrrhocoris TaxID=157538 RepID=A0A0N0DVR0_LEPPY|nr:hypothetical protein ABB37_04199 [Leptomonas pyrrhocoris]KPA80738.1 hypothetical protein ABB37_04199 [Leptomonas pyrrhocoris]|eukprot:XP_015659177.1 hypothetical protein ABB37_04199 [Leptomonas pyrrhocoris]
MLKHNNCLLKARLTTFNPWKHRPGGLHLNGRPQMVNPHFYRNKYKQLNPDDPSRLLKPSHVLLKRCPICKRTKFVDIKDKNMFHTCCEGAVMKLYSDMKSVMNVEQKVLSLTRQWDVENDRPWSNPHRPKPKGRSKLKKK